MTTYKSAIVKPLDNDGHGYIIVGMDIKSRHKHANILIAEAMTSWG